MKRFPETLPASEILCRIQRTHPPVPCTVKTIDTEPGFLSISPRIPLRATAPGQVRFGTILISFFEKQTRFQLILFKFCVFKKTEFKCW